MDARLGAATGSPRRIDETPRPVSTTCPYCGVGCGVLATRTADGALIAGDPSHPANFGRLCSKGSALGETVGLEDRLLYPEVDGVRASWSEATARIARAFSETIARHGPDSVALYVSGQLLTEDYYLANKLMKGFVGSANIDTNSRLCMASAVAGHRRAFGSDTVPCTYEDLEVADLVVLVGSNLAWCHPVLFQRLVAAKEVRPGLRIVAIDPRATATTEAADLHLAIAPESDVALFSGLLRHLAATAQDAAYVAAHTSGLEAALAAAEPWTVDAVAAASGVPAADVAAFYALVAATERTLTVFSQGVNQSSVGTDKVNAIINCHLATGRIGRPGMGPFSVTGQPNAMGGREVGGLANMLAAHMQIEDASHRALVQGFWQAPVIADRAGLKAVEMFEAVRAGRIKALWVMATNPAATMPQAARVEEALRTVPFLAVSEVVGSTDTLKHAHVKLPAAAWGEKDGTVTNSERRITRQRPFLAMPGEARQDWRIICDVAAAMGFADAFDYAGPHEIFDEHAALSGTGNDGTRDFDISGLTGLSREDYEALEPMQWPVRRDGGQARFFASGRFYTTDRRARFVPVVPVVPTVRPAPALTLNTGRVRDQWHTMTRTGRSARLSSHIGEPFAELHPDDAAAAGIAPAEVVRVSSTHGSVLVRALVTRRQRPGSVFVPMHWTSETSADARVGRLVTADVDPVSGQPALKSTTARVSRFPAALYGYAASMRPLAPSFAYWARVRIPRGSAVEFAHDAALDPHALAAELLGTDALVSVRGARMARFAAISDGTLVGAVFVADRPVEVSRSFVAGLIGTAAGAEILAGRPGAGRADPGPTVCVCFGVGAGQIEAACRAGAATVAAVGERVQAGSNCGSCRAEIARIVARVGEMRLALAAE